MDAFWNSVHRERATLDGSPVNGPAHEILMLVCGRPPRSQRMTRQGAVRV